jgi:FADH2 O2-dependent halogenase
MAALHVLAERYKVPEIKAVASYATARRELGSGVGVRRHFGFLLHREGAEQDHREANQTTNGPLSDSPHLPRPEADAYLLRIALRYGRRTLHGRRPRIPGALSGRHDGTGLAPRGVARPA